MIPFTFPAVLGCDRDHPRWIWKVSPISSQPKKQTHANGYFCVSCGQLKCWCQMPDICPGYTIKAKPVNDCNWSVGQRDAENILIFKCSVGRPHHFCFGQPLVFMAEYFIIRRELNKEVCVYPVRLPLNQIRCIWSIGQFRWKMWMNESVAPTGFCRAFAKNRRQQSHWTKSEIHFAVETLK